MSSYSGSRFVFVLWLSGCAYGSAGSLVRFSIMAVLFRIVSITRVVRDLSGSYSGSMVLRVGVQEVWFAFLLWRFCSVLF